MTTPARALLNRAMSEAQWQATVIDLARTLGWACLHINDSRKEIVDHATHQRRLVGDRDAAGLPDWLLVRERVVWAELKRQTGVTSARQREVLGALERAGSEVYVWRPSDWPEVERVLRKRGERR